MLSAGVRDGSSATGSGPSRGTWIGIDLGGTKIYAVVLAEGVVTAEAKRKTPTQGGPLAVVDAIVGLVGELGAGDAVGEVAGVGVGAPGVIGGDGGAAAGGVVHQASNLPGWLEPFALGTSLAAELGVPVEVENDVNVGTLAEHRLGAARGVPDVLGVFVGTGVGGGLVLDGRLRRGPKGYAGEIGHTVVRPSGRRCGCGGLGHLEAYAGRNALDRRARAADAAGEHTLLVELAKGRRMTSGVFARAFELGDPVTIGLLDEAVAALGAAIAAAVTLLDLGLVIVGGGLADRLGPGFVGRIEQAVRTRLFANGSSLHVVPASLGDQGGAVGAALVAADRIPAQG